MCAPSSLLSHLHPVLGRLDFPLVELGSAALLSGVIGALGPILAVGALSPEKSMGCDSMSAKATKAELERLKGESSLLEFGGLMAPQP